MRNFKNRLLRILVFSMAVVMCFAMATVSAFGYSYTTDSYDVNIEVGENNTYWINETIAVDFNESKHGIYRYIPVGNMDDLGYMKVKGEYVEDYNYTSYTEGGNMILQIGDEDIYVYGKQKYNIHYSMVVYEDRNEEKDFFYLDVIPTGWETPIESASVTIKFPKGIDQRDIEVYVGEYGYAQSNKKIWNYDEKNRTLVINTGHMDEGVGITVFCELPEGYWVAEASYAWAKIATVALGTILPAIIIALWFFYGRDKKIIPTVEFYPPNGMTPCEVGFVMDNTVDKKDLLSLILYYADRGYISIEETEEKDFVITKLQEIDEREKNFVRTLFEGLFKKGDSVRVSELDENFGNSYLTAYEQLNGHYFREKNRQMSLTSGVFQIMGFIFIIAMEVFMLICAQWYSGVIIPTIFAAICIVVSIVALVMAMVRSSKIYTMSKKSKVVSGIATWAIQVISLGIYSYIIGTMIKATWFAAVLFVLAFGAFVAVIQMRQRTKKNIELMGKLLGLKNFIEAAEVDRINALVEENPDYFYNVLPYAYVMGLTDKWVKNFEKIKIERPSWYVNTNDRDMFDVWMMSRMINNCNRSISSNIKYTVHEDSGSGGGGFTSSGGGFSGGGFGGGGGGSW